MEQEIKRESKNIFYSYAHEDERLRKQLEKHLEGLRRDGWITGWHDRKISPGAEWEHEIDTHLNTADIILLLISPDFLTSPYCSGKEVERAMERHEHGEARVIPILLRPVVWEWSPLSKLQALPRDGRPVIRHRNRDEAFAEIVHDIWDVIRGGTEKPVGTIPEVSKINLHQEENIAQESNRDSETEKQWNALREDIGKLIEEAVILINEELHEDPSRDELSTLQQQFERCRSIWRDQHFQVAILGLAKTGKSTLINALLGKEFLPASNEPKTARVVRIHHDQGNTNGTLIEKEKTLAEGTESISLYLERLNRQAREMNTHPSEDELLLKAPFIALAGQPLERQGFEVLDTPGLGEAGAEGLSQRVEDLLTEANVIICLLDYTRLKMAEEQQLIFRKLREIRQDLLYDKRRLFFVINRKDQMNYGSMDEEATLNYVANTVLREVAGLQIDQDRILLIAAWPALLARLIDNDQSSQGVVRDFARIVLGKGKAETATLDDCKPYVQGELLDSGVPRLEDKILKYLYSHCSAILFSALLGDLRRYLNVFHNYTEAKITTLTSNREELQSKLSQLRKDSKNLQNRISQVEKKANAYKKKVIADLQEELDTFLEDTTKEIFEIIGESGKIQTETEEHIQNELEELNNEILEHYRRQADEFKSKQEQSLIDYQNGLQELINNFLQEIDRIIGMTLQISLQPSSLPLPKASFRKSSIKQSTKRLIKHQTQVKHQTVIEYQSEIEYQPRTEYKDKVITTTRGQRMKEEGWITQQWLADIIDFFSSDIQHYTVQEPVTVQKPVTIQKPKEVQKSTKIEEYILSKRDLQVVWGRIIKEKTESWGKAILDMVDEQITQAIASVREQLETQTKTYSDILTQGITDSQLSDTEKKHLLDKKRTCRTQIFTLLKQGKAFEEILSK